MVKFSTVSPTCLRAAFQAQLEALVICLNPDQEPPYKPWRFRDSPEAIAAREAENPTANTAFVSHRTGSIIITADFRL